MSNRTFVTGFLPFGGHPVNPSALLAESSGRPHALLEVTFAAIDEFIDAFSADGFERLVLMGLRANGTAFDLEHVARNNIGGEADLHGIVRGPGPIEPGAPHLLTGTLFRGALPSFNASCDAGCYLCNYVYYRALRRMPGTRIGFLHVPPLQVMPLDAQRRQLDLLLDSV